MFSLESESKNIKRAFLLITVLFFIFTAFFILYYGDKTLLGSFKEYNNDDVKYVRTAKVLFEEGRFIYQSPNVDTVFIMPGLLVVIAFFMWIFGSVKGLIAFKIFQALAQTLCLMLVFFIGRKVFKSSKIAIIAMVLSSLYLADTWVASLYLTETLFKTLFLIMFYFLIYAIEERKMKYYIIAGICFGLSLLFRPPVALFPIVVIIMWIKEKYKFKEMAKYTGVVALIAITIMSPWWIRNYKQFNMFIPFTISSGSPMYIGTLIYDNDFTKVASIVKTKITGVEAQKPNDPLKGTKYDAFRPEKVEKKIKPGMTSEIVGDYELLDKGKNRVIGYMKTQPLKTLKWYLLDKTSQLFIAPFYWFKPFIIFEHIYHGILTIFSIIGLRFYFKNRNKNSTFMMLSILYFVLVAIPFTCFSRYYYPLMPFSIITAAYGIYTLHNNHRIKKTLKTDGKVLNG